MAERWLLLHDSAKNSKISPIVTSAPKSRNCRAAAQQLRLFGAESVAVVVYWWDHLSAVVIIIIALYG